VIAAVIRGCGKSSGLFMQLGGVLSSAKAETLAVYRSWAQDRGQTVERREHRYRKDREHEELDARLNYREYSENGEKSEHIERAKALFYEITSKKIRLAVGEANGKYLDMLLDDIYNKIFN
jgi:beta-phosphoglucomutase-like phosphatase (HAD superfamily)